MAGQEIMLEEWAAHWQEKYDAPAVRRTAYEAHRYVLETTSSPAWGNGNWRRIRPEHINTQQSGG